MSAAGRPAPPGSPGQCRILGRISAWLLLAAVLAGCASGESGSSREDPSDPTAGAPRRGGTISVGTTGEASGWLPFVDRWGPGPTVIAKTLFDPLAAWSAEGTVAPYLAESFEPNDDHSVWDVVLRPDVAFHDGTPVDAAAVALSIEEFRTSPLTVLAMAPVTGVEAVAGDPLRVRITLDQPWVSFPALFTSQLGYVAAPSQVRALDTQRPIGSGPFRFERWTPDAELVVRRHDRYWRTDDGGEALPYLDEVRFTPMPDEQARLSSLQTGDLDVAQTISPTTVARTLTDPGSVPDGVQVLEDGSESDEYHVLLNTQTGPFADARLRRAVQLATDREQIIDAFDGAFLPADGPMSPASRWWADSGWPEPDLEAARELVEAYRVDNPGPIEVRVSAGTSGDLLELAQRVEQYWAEIGLDVRLEGIEQQAFSQRITSGDFDAMMFQYWNGADPDVNYHFWNGDSIGGPGELSVNFTRWSNDVVDEALDVARAAADTERAEAYATVWRAWAEHVPYLWIFHSRWLILYRDRVHGLDGLDLPDGSAMEPVVWGGVFLTATWVSA